MKKDKNFEFFRKKIREFIQNESDLKELDLIIPKKAEWKDEIKDLRKELVGLLKNIENDSDKEMAGKIDSAISKLNSWKKKIEKFL